MNIRHRNTVYIALRLRNQSIYSHNIILYFLRQCKMLTYNMFNVMQAAMMMRMTMCIMFMLMHLIVFTDMFMLML